MEELIEGFIATFVLCPTDKNVETDIRRKKRANAKQVTDASLFLCCSACGQASKLKDDSKRSINRYILTTYDTFKDILQSNSTKFKAARKTTAVAVVVPTTGMRPTPSQFRS